MRESFGLAASSILAGACMCFGYIIVYPITKVAGVSRLIRSRSIKIYARLYIVGVPVATVFIVYILAALKIVIIAYDET
jgi:hypothetical protein